MHIHLPSFSETFHLFGRRNNQDLDTNATPISPRQPPGIYLAVRELRDQLTNRERLPAEKRDNPVFVENPASELGRIISDLNQKLYLENFPTKDEPRVDRYNSSANGISFTREREGAPAKAVVALFKDPEAGFSGRVRDLRDVTVAVMVDYDNGENLVRVHAAKLFEIAQQWSIFNRRGWGLNDVVRLIPSFNAGNILAAAAEGEQIRGPMLSRVLGPRPVDVH